MNKVTIFIVGVAKCGTSTLHRSLDAHHSVVMSVPKEPNYFAAEEIHADENFYYKEKIISSEKDYARCFPRRGKLSGMLLGEASVPYLQYEGVAAKIHAYNPDARIIILLRNPVERAWSHYLMDRRLGYCDRDFTDILDHPETHPGHYRQYIEIGHYDRYISLYETVFGAHNILILDIEDLKHHAESTYRRLCDYIGIEYSPCMLDVENENSFLTPKSSMVGRLYARPEMRQIARCLLPMGAKKWLRNRFFASCDKPALPEEIRRKLEVIYRDNYYWRY